MEIVSLSDGDAAEPMDGAHLTQLIAGEEMSVQHFRIEPGAVVEEHSHPHEQTGYLVSGELVFFGEGEEHVVRAGDSYTVPGGEPHGVENRSDEDVVGVELFHPPRANPPWLE